MQTAKLLLVIALALLSTAPAQSLEGSLSENMLIESKALGYSLQYRVYLPEGAETKKLPVLFVTDGQWYIETGGLPQVMDELSEKKAIEPALVVFVDSRDPEKPKNNRRNQQFFCNGKYAEFFTGELIPSIDAQFPTTARREDRVILGLSFGGLNSACFGLLANESFGGIAMQSPATHPVPQLHVTWRDMPKVDLRIFLSTGTKRDNEASTRSLHRILKDKGYDMEYIEVDEGHDWRNWKPLLDDVALFFFGTDKADTGSAERR